VEGQSQFGKQDFEERKLQLSKSVLNANARSITPTKGKRKTNEMNPLVAPLPQQDFLKKNESIQKLNDLSLINSS